jgi:hypothetical protein
MDTQPDDTPENPEPENLPAIKLGDAYDHCLLGATIRGRYAYSLKLLIETEATNRKVPRSKAEEFLREEIVSLAQTYGAECPEIVDDTLMPDEGPKIIRPSTWRGKTGG